MFQWTPLEWLVSCVHAYVLLQAAALKEKELGAAAYKAKDFNTAIKVQQVDMCFLIFGDSYLIDISIVDVSLLIEFNLQEKRGSIGHCINCTSVN